MLRIGAEPDELAMTNQAGKEHRAEVEGELLDEVEMV